MLQIICKMSYDELVKSSELKVKGSTYKRIPGMNLFTNEYAVLLQFDTRGNVGFKPVYKNNLGYAFLTYCGKTYFIHRLMALTYGLIDTYEYDELKEVDHINDVRDDNRLINLQILTKTENLQKRKKTNNKKIVLSRGSNRYEFNSKSEAAQWLIDNGYTDSDIQRVKENLARKHNKYYGFILEEVKK